MTMRWVVQDAGVAGDGPDRAAPAALFLAENHERRWERRGPDRRQSRHSL
jgi:hypothetical protein